MRDLLEWTAGHWAVPAVIALVLGLVVLAFQTVVWILSHSD
jgi:hypothetical protein